VVGNGTSWQQMSARKENWPKLLHVYSECGDLEEEASAEAQGHLQKTWPERLQLAQISIAASRFWVKVSRAGVEQDSENCFGS